MRLGCLRCWRDREVFTPAQMIFDPFGRPYEVRCDNCNESMAEAAAQQLFEDYHGGVAPDYVYEATSAAQKWPRR